MDNPILSPGIKWMVVESVKIVVVCVLIGLLFYNSLWGGLVVAPVGLILWKLDRKNHVAAKKDRIEGEFKDFIVLISGNLNAGYSLENAFLQAKKEFVGSRENSIIGYELEKMVNGLRCHNSLEDMLLSFGNSTQIGEIIDFANLIRTAKQHGGNIIKLIKRTVNNFAEKYSVEMEIKTMISAKKLEGRIMLLAPLAIVLYMRMTNGNYMEILYNTTMGRVIMTLCLVVVLVSGLFIEKIIDIEV